MRRYAIWSSVDWPSRRMVMGGFFQMHSDLHPETQIDLFITEPFDFEEEYAGALVGELLPALSSRFVRLATLIRMKEAAGREKDREDIRQLQMLAKESADE